MRVFTACLFHETCNVSPIPTTLKNFEEMFLYRPSTGDAAGAREAYEQTMGLRAWATEHGHTLVESVIASAMPSLPLVRYEYEALRDEILGDLGRAMPVDAVFLFLHGAQMAQGYDDVEGDILRRTRLLVGDDVPIGVELDLHANLTQDMVRYADILIACKEYPHTDFRERSRDILTLLQRCARREIQPVAGISRIPMYGIFPTTREPMISLMNQIAAIEANDEAVLSISLCHGFPATDYEEVGATVMVLTDNDPAKARALADQVAEKFFAIREEANTRYHSFEDAIDAGLSIDGGPVVVADGSDNLGGAAPGDSTFLLRYVLERGIENAALAMIWDPVAVEFCEAAGEGATLPLRIGGKVCPVSGPPLDVQATVLCINRNAHQQALGMRSSLGTAVSIEVAGVEVVLNTVRQQTFTPECFTEVGIDPSTRKFLFVKSAQHFYKAFAPLAKSVVHTRRFTNIKEFLESLKLTRLRRPAWPLDRTPFEAFGRRWL